MAVYVPEHTLAGDNPYINRGWGSSYGASYLQSLGEDFDVTLVDENLYKEKEAQYQQEALKNSTIIFATLIWEPYIPWFLDKAYDRILQGKKVCVWGPGVYHFSQEERRTICLSKGLDHSIPRYFEEDKITNILWTNYKQPIKEQLSNSLILNQIPDNLRIKYLSNEICMYLSDGCKYACDFCAVENRTRKWQSKVIEKYRDFNKFSYELDFYANKAKSLGLEKLQVYFSSLDIFQTPSKIIETWIIINKISQKYNIKIYRRLLPTFESVEIFIKNYGIEQLKQLHDYWLVALWPWVDSMWVDNWKKLKKGHNTIERLYTIPKLLHSVWITTELLMVFCHPKIDTFQSLWAAKDYLEEMHEKYGAVPRIHIAKSALAGTTGPTGWNSDFNIFAKDLQLHEPDHFLMKDFLARPNRLSHPNQKEREMFYDIVLRIEDIIKDRTYDLWTIPPSLSHDAIDPHDSHEKQILIKELNKGRYDH